MANQNHPTRRIKVVFRHSSVVLKCVVLAAVVLSIVALIALRTSILDVQAQNQALHNQAAQLEEANQELEEDIRGASTQEGIKKIATEILGLVDPKTKFFESAD